MTPVKRRVAMTAIGGLVVVGGLVLAWRLWKRTDEQSKWTPIALQYEIVDGQFVIVWRDVNAVIVFSDVPTTANRGGEVHTFLTGARSRTVRSGGFSFEMIDERDRCIIAQEPYRVGIMADGSYMEAGGIRYDLTGGKPVGVRLLRNVAAPLSPVDAEYYFNAVFRTGPPPPKSTTTPDITRRPRAIRFGIA
jgi:hypothetical protein